MKVPISSAPLGADQATLVLGAAAEGYRLGGEMPPGGDTSAVTDGAVELDVPFGQEGIVFFSAAGALLGARMVRVGQTHGDPYRAIRLDVSKEHLTVTLDVTEQVGPDPGDVQAGAEVEWGDGGYEVVAAPVGTLSHTYERPGSYEIHIRFGYETDPRPSYAHHRVVLDEDSEPPAMVTFAPSIASLNPESVQTGTPELQLSVLGADFQLGAVITFDGADAVTSTWHASSHMSCVLPTIDEPGSHTVTVRNPDGAESAPATFTVT